MTSVLRTVTKMIYLRLMYHNLTSDFHPFTEFLCNCRLRLFMNRSRSATPEPRPAARDAPNSGGGPDGRRIRSRSESGRAPEPPAGWQPIGNQAAAIAAIGELQDALMEQLDGHQDVLALAATVGAPLDPTRSPSNGGRARGAVTRV